MKKFVKRVVLGAAVLVVAPFVVAAFLPRQFVIEREVVIDRPKDDVFDYIRQLENQAQYSKWARIDPAMKKSFRGTDGAVGSVYAWESDHQDVGIGEQEITAIQEGKRVDFEIRFTKPFQSTDPAYITTESLADNRTRVKSVYHGKMNYPSNILCSIICDNVGEGMETSLSNLKAVLEKPSQSDEATTP